MDGKSCEYRGCGRLATSVLANRRYCGEHFVATSRAELSRYFQIVQEKRLWEIPRETVRKWIDECVREADVLDRRESGLDDSLRQQLQDIILSAVELGRNLRRSPRVVAQIHLRVGAGEWREETDTKLISRFGALITVHHPVAVNEMLTIVRPDRGRAVHARVAWIHETAPQTADVGIEFLDAENFWELDWTKSTPF